MCLDIIRGECMLSSYYLSSSAVAEGFVVTLLVRRILLRDKLASRFYSCQ